MRRPHISVFTPSHDTRFLEEAYKSLLSQTFTDWEWIVLLNGNAIESNLNEEDWMIEHDPRVKIIDASEAIARTKSVGALKREAITYCSGQILVELDHDDILTTTCLERVAATYKANPTAALVYSDWAQFNEDGTPNDEKWNEAHGWVYRDETVTDFRGMSVQSVPHAAPPLPTNAALIWYAPNHVRSFTRKSYDLVDGYDANRNVMDDGDLMARLYQIGSFVHIPECLYLQRVGLTGTVNTQKDPALNAQIQEDTLAVYNQQIEGMMTAWSIRENLDLIYLNQEEMNNWGDLFLGTNDDSCGLIVAPGVMQYLPKDEIIPFMAECYRVLKHGGMLLAVVPSTDGRLAYMNFDYQTYWNENTFWQFVNPQWTNPAILESQRWQLTRSFTYASDQFNELQRLLLVRADLVALKEGPLVYGVNLWKTLVHENPTGSKSVGTALA